jgi:hypothetical protein
MGVTIEAVDPRGHAAEAAAVLQAAWAPPRLRYAPEDLAWQFARPGWGPPRAWLARNGAGEPVGFAAALPRTVRFAGRPYPVWLCSYYAALASGHGAAVALLRAEVRDLKATGRPTVVFAAPGSAGEAMLRVNDAAGLRRNTLAQARVHGGVGAADGPAGVEVREAAPADARELADLLALDRRDGAIGEAVDPAALAHDALDPRGRCWAVVRGPSGALLAAACAHLAETVAADGPARVPTLSAVTLPREGDGDALAGLVGFAARRWADRATTPVVTVPNPAGISPAALRAARLRALPASWAAYVFCADPADPLLAARSTTLEVI